MAHIEDLKNGKYRISMCVERKRASKVVEAKNLKAAEKMAVLLEENLRETGSIDKLSSKALKNMTFGELWDRYIKWQTEGRIKQVRPKTAQKYTDLYHYQLSPYFGGMQVRHITEDDVNDFVNKLRNPESRFNKSKKKPYSAATIKDAFVLLNGMLNYAIIKLKVISDNPCEGADKPTIGKQKADYYNDVQLQKLLDVVDKETELKLAEIYAKEVTGRYRPFTLQKEKVQALYKKASIYIAVYTAARRGEVLGIHRQDIDFENNTITFCHDIVYTKLDGIIMMNALKSADTNTVGMPDELADILKCLIHELDILFEVSNGVIPYTDRLFMALRDARVTTVGGLPFPDRYSEQFLEMLERNNLPRITFHKLRHSAISYMLYRKVPKSVVARIAGHSSTEQINKTYEHVYDVEKYKAAQVFNDIKKGKDVEDEQEVESSSSEATGSGD